MAREVRHLRNHWRHRRTPAKKFRQLERRWRPRLLRPDQAHPPPDAVTHAEVADRVDTARAAARDARRRPLRALQLSHHL
eukprot:8932779-Pyramimonas_sp.AAC.1